MDKTVDVIDIGTCALRAVKYAAESFYKVGIAEFPKISTEPVIIPKIVGQDTHFVTLLTLTHAPSSCTGYVSIHVLKKNVKAMLELKDTKSITNEGLNKSCLDYCDLAVETFKLEINSLALENVHISEPKHFANSCNEQIEKVDVDAKHTMSLVVNGEDLITVDFAFQGIASTASLLK